MYMMFMGKKRSQYSPYCFVKEAMNKDKTDSS